MAGTAILLLGGFSAIAFDFGRGSPFPRLVPDASLRLLVTGVIFAGSGALVAVSALGRRSGAHLNPAVTAAFWRLGHIDPGDVAGYMAGQLLGAFVATLLARALWRGWLSSAGDGITRPGRNVSSAEAFAVEAAMTALLVLVIFGMVVSPGLARWTPVAVWVTIAVLVWQLAPVTGTSLNPARSVAPALLSDTRSQLWIYLLGPMIGAMTAAEAWIRVVRLPLATAKIFHDPSFPSVLHTTMPAMTPKGRSSIGA